jgi:paraquat-inducible protein A
MKFASKPDGMNPREDIVCCQTCGLAQQAESPRPHTRAVCPRCGSTVSEYKASSVVPTAALSLAALILYVPANIYPILRMERYGAYSESTVWGGVTGLTSAGYWFVALVVFLASMVVPLLKLAGLFFLVITAELRTQRWQRQRTWIYRLIEVIGPWAMLDVFLLAVLVALVRLGQLATVMPGRGLLAFTCMVVLTMFASAAFDPRLIWKSREKPDDWRRAPQVAS